MQIQNLVTQHGQHLQSALLIWYQTMSAKDLSLLVCVLVFHRVVARLGMWPYAIFTLIGTIAHELGHFLTAKVLFAKPSFPSLIPKKTESGWRLGSVAFQPNLFKNIPISLAPFLLAPLGLWWSIHYMHTATGGWYLIHAWIAGTVIMASSPSSQDWKIAAPSLVIIAVVVAAYCWKSFS